MLNTTTQPTMANVSVIIASRIEHDCLRYQRSHVTDVMNGGNCTLISTVLREL